MSAALLAAALMLANCLPSLPSAPGDTQYLCLLYASSQVEVAVVTRTVLVRHAPALICPATLVAALNEAQLEASLTFPRHQASVGYRQCEALIQSHTLHWDLCT